MLTQKMIQEFKESGHLYATHHEKYGTYPTEEELARYDKANVFLMHVSQLYFECAGCERRVAPDEERYQDPASEAWYCMECLKEGI